VSPADRKGVEVARVSCAQAAATFPGDDQFFVAMAVGTGDDQAGMIDHADVASFEQLGTGGTLRAATREALTLSVAYLGSQEPK
jgi:hypothetical protein